MTLEIHRPQKPLADYVDMMWFYPHYQPLHAQERILPMGVIELNFNLADEAFSLCDITQQHAQQVYGGMVAGARSQPFIVDTSRSTAVLSVLFKAGGAERFFSTCAADLHNRHVPLRFLWGASADELYEQLLEAKTNARRFELLENALLKRLTQTRERHQAVNYALPLLYANPTAHKIAAVVDRIALSPTRFIKVFHDEIGMTPKLFCRVLRFQNALTLMARETVTQWADFALKCGYYDQSHLINDFQSFAGITPTTYTPQDPRHINNLPV